jgi:hypothetical protein
LKSLDIYVVTSSEWTKEKVYELISETKVKIKFHVIDEVDLLIRKMIENHKPVECPGLEIGKDGAGKAARKFNVLILGFRTIGQRALTHLILNGQFVQTSGENDDADTVDQSVDDIKAKPVMRATILDKEADRLLICYRNDLPALDLVCEAEHENMTIPCDGLSKHLGCETEHETSGIPDYIVITFQDARLNRYTARYIYNYYRNRGVNKDKMPFIAVYDKNAIAHEVKDGERIFSFGCRDEIFTDAIIIREENDKKAMSIKGLYSELVGEKLKMEWRGADLFEHESNRASAGFIDTMLILAGVTKKDTEKDTTTSLTTDKDLIETLAHTEHLRWNAFHVVMGYKCMSIDEMKSRFKEHFEKKLAGNSLNYARKDTENKYHVCLVSYDGLDKVSKEYIKLAQRAYDEENDDMLKEKYKKQTKRDFKGNDRDIVINIPKILKSAKEKGNG